jgi:hypothetical protein
MFANRLFNAVSNGFAVQITQANSVNVGIAMPQNRNHSISGSLTMLKLLSLVGIMVLSGCVENMIPDPYGFKWVNPNNGDVFYENDVKPGATPIVLSYTSTPPSDISFSFNSQPVQSCFSKTAENTLEADLYCFKDFFCSG